MYTCFSRYLTAKKTVDDRSLNAHVFNTFKQTVAAQNQPLRILEIGCGSGTMIERLLDNSALTNAHYTALDQDQTNLKVLRHRLKKRGFTTDDFGKMAQQSVTVEVIAQDILSHTPPHLYDLIIAHAVLDLFQLHSTLPQLLALLKPNGHYYFTLNFDGITTFQPTINPAFDAQIERLYHRTMDTGIPNGRPPATATADGHLLALLQTLNAPILAAGSSDWVVVPQQHQYLADEAYFLHFIINCIEEALTPHAQLDPQQLKDWIARRHQQIEQGELIYIAHQIDVFGSVAKS